MNYYVISLNHTRRSDRYITLWRPDDKGYAYPTPWAGRYAREHVLAHLSYYNSGNCTVAVPCEVLDAVAVPPAPRMIDGDAGPVVLNTRANWQLILANTIEDPAHPARPQYKGAPRLAA